MNRKTATIAVTLALLLVGGAAFAYWTVGGGGTGTAETGTSQDITVVQTSTVTDLRPGGAPQALSGNFDNANEGPVYVGTVTVAIGTVTKAAGAPAGPCDATDYTLANATMTVNAEVPTGTGQGAWSGATIAFNNKTDTNQDGCKGATVNLTYTIG